MLFPLLFLPSEHCFHKHNTVAAQVEKDLINSISIGILSALLEEFLGKPFLPESPESPHSPHSPLSPLSPELGDCIIPNKHKDTHYTPRQSE
jgi:hypothetical protein